MNNTKQQTEKAILSLRVAQSLMKEGYNLIRIEQSNRHRGKLAFIFEYSEEIERELAKFARKRD